MSHKYRSTYRSWNFGLSIPVFFITTNAWLLWFALPVLVGQVRRLRRRNPRNSGAGQAPG